MPLHTQTVGNGPPLILVHGWALHSGIWQPLREALATCFQVTTLDLPGHGRSPLAGDFTLDNVVNQLHDAVPRGGTWLGWSLGGLLAMALAARFPACVHRLILVASSPRFTVAPDWPSAMDPQLLQQFAASLATDYAGTVKRFLFLVAQGSARQSGVLRQIRAGIAADSKPAPAALRGGLRILQETDLRKELHRIECASAVILGRNDRLVPVDAGLELCRDLPRCRAHVVAGAGHAPFLSHPEEFTKTVTSFCQ